MQGTAQKSHMSTDRLTTGQTADGLVYHSLENGGSQVFLGSAFINQRLNVCFGKYTTSGCNGIERLVIFGIFVQTRCVSLQKRSHLIDERAGSSGADTVHTLLYIAAFKIDNFCILSSKFNCHICLWGQFFKRSGNCNDFLYKRNFQMIGKGQSSGACNDRCRRNFTQGMASFVQKVRQRILDICKMPFVIRKK